MMGQDRDKRIATFLAQRGAPPTGDGCALHEWAMKLAEDIEAAERERCARVCDDEERIRAEAGDAWPEESPERSRCYAAARAAINCARGVRGGEVVEPNPAVQRMASITGGRAMGKRISGYWNKGDKVVSDRVRVNVIAQRMASELGKEWHEGTPLTFCEAKDLAITMLYDFAYREWRSAQMDAMPSNALANRREASELSEGLDGNGEKHAS